MKDKSCYAIQVESLYEEKYLVPDISSFKTDVKNKFKPNLSINNEERFYHYTTLDLAIKILTANEFGTKDGKIELWASQQQFSNDNEEMTNGLALIRDYFESEKDELNKKILQFGIDRENDNDKIKSIIDEFIERIESYQTRIDTDQDIYIICFCMNGDLLSQWKYYGRNCGIAIEFDLKAMRYSGLDGKDKDLGRQRDYPVGPYRVVYCDAEKRKIIENIVNNALEESKTAPADKKRVLLDHWNQVFAVSPLFKHKDFHEEAECRLLFRPVFTDEYDAQDIFYYRERNGTLLPYMKIKLHPQNGGTGVKSITIGPGQNQELIKKGFEHMFERKGLDIPIICSETPFRS